jgi:superfamily II DNA/RNA helicase
VEALARHGFDTPFAIQARTLSDSLAGRDILGRAQTGGGKTLAFAVPLVARLAAAGRPHGRRAPRALVLVPTRELAGQVSDAIDPLAAAVGLRATAVYGGAPIGRQIDRMRRGVDIVVATPGRLIDLLERAVCALDDIEITVLDEADQMADLGFLPAVTRILEQTPVGGQRVLFSATLDRGVDRLVEEYLENPAMHATAPAVAPVDAADHRVFTVRADDKVAVAAEVASGPGRTLVFVRTKHGANRLTRQLNGTGVDAMAIHGGLTQNARQRSLNGFAAGRPRVLVATDVAARGIHVDGIDLVVHFDPPADHKDYLHRSGRTARAGASGTVLVLAQPHEVSVVARLHQNAQVSAKPTVVHPGHEAIRRLAESGRPSTAQPAANLRSGDGPRRSERSESRDSSRQTRRRSTQRRSRQRDGRPRGAAA